MRSGTRNGIHESTRRHIDVRKFADAAISQLTGRSIRSSRLNSAHVASKAIWTLVRTSIGPNLSGPHCARHWNGTGAILFPRSNIRIDRRVRHDLAYRTLAGLRGVDFAKYRDDRRAAGRAENTIRLELQIICHMFEIARKEWGMEGLSNPLNNIRKPTGSQARDRRLRPGEFGAPDGKRQPMGRTRI